MATVVLHPARADAAPREMTTMVMDITPEQAREFLRGNASNRPLRRSWVKTLRESIERGEWKLTHQGIALTTDLQLLDGQHRLHAIVEAGVTVKMNVTFDCDPGAYAVIDGGIKRTASDQLRVQPMVAAVARNLFRLPNYTIPGVVTSAQIAEVLGWANDLIQRVTQIGGNKSPRTSAAVQVAILVHLMAGREESLTKFAAFAVQDFDTLAPMQKALMRQITDGKAATSRNQWDMTARAWRAFHPDHWETDRLQITNMATAIAEMVRTVEAYRRRISR